MRSSRSSARCMPRTNRPRAIRRSQRNRRRRNDSPRLGARMSLNPILKSALDSWTIPRGTVAMLLLTAAIYARGFGKLHMQMPERFSLRRLAAFMGGVATLLIAIASPLAALDDVLLQVHMIQHLLLMLVAPVLILAGWPAIAMLRGLPPRVSRSVLVPILRSRKVRALFSWLAEPIVAWIAFTAAIWIWHTPAAFQRAMRSENWHAFEHACFFATALMYWWPVIQPWPSARRWPRGAMIPNHVLYPLYASAPRLGGISPLDDQIVAGAIMWMPGSLFFLIPAAIIMFQILAPRSLTIANSQIASAAGGSRAADSVARLIQRRQTQT